MLSMLADGVFGVFAGIGIYHVLASIVVWRRTRKARAVQRSEPARGASTPERAFDGVTGRNEAA